MQEPVDPPHNSDDVQHENGTPANVRDLIVFALKSIYDPEIPVNIHDLGLIYRVEVDEAGKAEIDMTLTAPNCPAAQILPEQVRRAAAAVKGVEEVELKIVWDPPWGPDRMSEVARVQLGLE